MTINFNSGKNTDQLERWLSTANILLESCTSFLTMYYKTPAKIWRASRQNGSY
jgi:hypothetical protein